MFSFFKKTYYPLNAIEVSSKAFSANYDYLSNLNKDIKVAPVLKSNAYGHGLVATAKILDNLDAPFLCVDSIYEAYELFKNHIKTPILIMGYIHPENLKVKRLPFSYAVYDKEQVHAVSSYQPHAKIHIFVDTGMHREGISPAELPELVSCIKSNTIQIEGLMSHLAAADKPESGMTLKQLKEFERAQHVLAKADIHPQWVHIGASSALLNQEKYKGKIGNLARCGISLYGIDPEGEKKQLQPVLKLMTTLVQVKDLKKGEKVGYDFTYTAAKDLKMGILPMGYFDGVDRRLSDKGSVIIKDVVCPIVGRVSMNLTTVDVSGVSDVQVGDRVIVYSDNPVAGNSFFNAAVLCDTIPYDILVHLAGTTRRVVIS